MAAHKEFKGILLSDKTKIGKYISCATLQSLIWKMNLTLVQFMEVIMKNKKGFHINKTKYLMLRLNDEVS